MVYRAGKPDLTLRDEVGNTPLILALKSSGGSDPADTLKKVLLLLEAGFSPYETNIHQESALHFACLFGLVECCKLLIEKKVSLDSPNRHGLTPLHMASIRSGKL